MTRSFRKAYKNLPKWTLISRWLCGKFSDDNSDILSRNGLRNNVSTNYVAYDELIGRISKDHLIHPILDIKETKINDILYDTVYAYSVFFNMLIIWTHCMANR